MLKTAWEQQESGTEKSVEKIWLDSNILRCERQYPELQVLIRMISILDCLEVSLCFLNEL